MASGDPVVQIIHEMPPGTLAALLDVRAGGSTPAEGVLLHDFDASTIWYLDLLCLLVGYDGGGLEFTGPWSASTATSGEVRLEIAIRRMQDDAEDIDAAHTYVYNGVTDTAPSVSGELSYPTIAFTDGADMDLWADGELAIVRVRRNTAHGDDDMSGDMELWSISGVEA